VSEFDRLKQRKDEIVAREQDRLTAPLFERILTLERGFKAAQERIAALEAENAKLRDEPIVVENRLLSKIKALETERAEARPKAEALDKLKRLVSGGRSVSIGSVVHEYFHEANYFYCHGTKGSTLLAAVQAVKEE
jgi:predicted nuclease with TOPRIM domain